MHENLIERLRNFEGSDALGNGDFSLLHEAADALEAARGDGWQPIETAPNDAWFLVHSDRGWIGLARRSDPDYAPDEGWFEDEHTEFLDPAWLTHWRPLPAPPAIDQALGKGVADGA